MIRARRAIFALAALMAAVPAAAQTVTVYGRLFPEVVWVRMTGSTQPGTEVSTLAQPPTGETFDSNVQMDSSNSRLGFRGEEALGGGLKAFFQIEDVEFSASNFPLHVEIKERESELQTFRTWIFRRHFSFLRRRTRIELEHFNDHCLQIRFQRIPCLIAHSPFMMRDR